MAGGTPSSTGSDMEVLIRRLERIEAWLSSMAGSNGLESAVITGPDGFVAYDATTGSRVSIRQGQIQLWDDFDNNPYNFGRIVVDPGVGANMFRWLPPFSDGTGAENSVTAQGRRSGAAGNVWVYSDGQILIRAQDANANKVGGVTLAAEVITLDANQIRPYGMEPTGGGTPIVMEVVGGAPVMKISSSALKYKQDVETYEVDPETALKIRTVLFRDRSAVEERGDDAPLLVGVIADELDELGLTHFVDYDEDGEVRGARYDRIWIALLSLAKSEHAKRVEMAEQIATLTARLDALEAK